MFRPNATALFIRKSEVRTIHGKEMYFRGVKIRCAIVNLTNETIPSPVRADSSASRGSAQDLVAQAKILVPKNTKVSNGDIIEILGFRVEVTGRQPRVDVSGRLDHIEVTGRIKAEL